MPRLSAKYKGKMQTLITQLPTGKTIDVDLAKKYGGSETSFDPTDVLSGALAACAMSMMAVMASKRKEDITGTQFETDYEMKKEPTRVGKFIFTVTFPAHITKEQKDFYKGAFNVCPVHNTLRPDTELVINIK